MNGRRGERDGGRKYGRSTARSLNNAGPFIFLLRHCSLSTCSVCSQRQQRRSRRDARMGARPCVCIRAYELMSHIPMSADNGGGHVIRIACNTRVVTWPTVFCVYFLDASRFRFYKRETIPEMRAVDRKIRALSSRLATRWLIYEFLLLD